MHEQTRDAHSGRWRIEIEAFKSGERSQLAAFDVALEQGKLEDVSVATSLP